VSVLDLRALLATLNEHGVRYVVIGGVAVGAHGYVRATEDLDIVPEPTAETADRLARALAELEATLPLSGGRPSRTAGDVIAISHGRSLTADTRHGGLDVVQRVPGVPAFEELDRSAVDAELLGVLVRVCDLEHLRQMKHARGSAQDRADLENLPEQ